MPQNIKVNMERRNYARFQAQDNCYAVLRGNYTKVGKICDISSDGLAFKYLGKELAAETYSHVNIFLIDNGFYLPHMPCKIIYETEDESFGKDFLPQIYRCGLQFLEQTKSQSEQLEFFMQNYAAGPAAV